MIISSKQTAKFINPKNNAEFHITNGYIGEVPKWVEDDWYFKLLAADGSVTEIIAEKTKAADIDTDKAAKEAAVKALKEAINKAKSEAKVEAEKEAEEKGLDVNAKKALIAEKQAAAESKIKAEFNKES